MLQGYLYHMPDSSLNPNIMSKHALFTTHHQPPDLGRLLFLPAGKEGAAAVKRATGEVAPKARGSLWSAESPAALKALGAYSSRKKPDGWTFSRAPVHTGENLSSLSPYERSRLLRNVELLTAGQQSQQCSQRLGGRVQHTLPCAQSSPLVFRQRQLLVLYLSRQHPA